MRALFACLLIPAVLTTAAADTFVVDVDGTTPYQTITDGISAAGDGDTVLIRSGVYTGSGNAPFACGAKRVFICSESDSPDSVTIDCQSSSRGVHINGGQDTTFVLRSVTITGGWAEAGGGVSVDGCSPKFENVTFFANWANRGAAVGIRAGGRPVFRDCFFESNTTSAGGGAVHAGGSGTSALFRNCGFFSNEAGGSGGAVVADSSAVVDLKVCEFRSNDANNEGGAIYCDSGAEVNALGCLIVDNTAMTCAGLYCSRAKATVSDCTFRGNVGDIQCGALRFHEATDSWVMYSTFQRNSCGYRGGAIECNSCDPHITNCTLIENNADDAAAGLFLYDSDVVVERTIIAFSTHGEAVLCDGGFENPTFTNCLIYQNAGGDSLCGTYANNDFSNPPRFCDKADHNLALCQDSFCLPSANPWGVTVGAFGQGCGPCASSVERTSWGTIKSLYR